jgi:hypothetical protein
MRRMFEDAAISLVEGACFVVIFGAILWLIAVI